MTFRLPAPAGRLIDRDRSLKFTFEGKNYEGFAGDTVASALTANGLQLLSRSFKYHRPRGIQSACGAEANTLMRINDEPNSLADRVALVDGMNIQGQNYFGSLQNDWAAVLDRMGRFLPVGFYYKAFYKPKAAWNFWNDKIRRLAGIGRVTLDQDRKYYDKSYLFYDVVVIGGGPAGINAAIEASKTDAEVLLVDEMSDLGGSLAYARFDAANNVGDKILEQLTEAIAKHANVDVMTDTTCTGLFPDGWLSLVRGNRLYKLRAKSVVVAAGSYEQPVIFRNNDRPGVMLGSAAQRLIKLYGVRPGRRAVVVTANGDGYGVALDLLESGVKVACIADLRAEPGNEPRSEEILKHGVEIFNGHTAYEVNQDKGGKGMMKATISPITGEGVCGTPRARIDCDLVLMSSGYSPVINLLCMGGGKLVYDQKVAMFAVSELPPHLYAAGSVNGTYDLASVELDGRIAGWSAANDIGFSGTERPPELQDKGATEQTHPWPIFPHPQGREFVDFDEDLQIKDIKDTVAEGYDSIELVKRYSTGGMGPSQGRHSSVAIARLCAEATNSSLAEVGLTTIRPPFRPEKFGQLAGRSFEPVRKSAMYHRQQELGAKWMLAGIWLRPEYYGSPNQRSTLIRSEALNVRRNVGLIDVSPLGGVEVRGPDAAEFLNRMYTFSYLKQPIGRARYVLMTDIGGVIVDDGVAARLHENRFYVTATTSGVDGVYQSMLWYNAQWRLDVDVTNVTVAYAAVNIAGPKSRDILQPLCDIDLSADKYPYMGVREGHVGDIPAILMRVGFVGELGFEVHVPADHGEALWDILMEAGRSEEIRPFGVEAQRLLRLEKGHIIVGQDTDGLTTPNEADMAWAISRKKPFFVGNRSVFIQEADDLKRKLVGFELKNPNDSAPRESHLVVRDGEITGWVTSASYSPVLEKVIGLAYLAPDQAEPGTAFSIKSGDGQLIGAQVVAVPFYDPDNERQEL